jgi:hypothetical protein
MQLRVSINDASKCPTSGRATNVARVARIVDLSSTETAQASSTPAPTNEFNLHALVKLLARQAASEFYHGAASQPETQTQETPE